MLPAGVSVVHTQTGPMRVHWAHQQTYRGEVLDAYVFESIRFAIA